MICVKYKINVEIVIIVIFLQFKMSDGNKMAEQTELRDTAEALQNKWILFPPAVSTLNSDRGLQQNGPESTRSQIKPVLIHCRIP